MTLQDSFSGAEKRYIQGLIVFGIAAFFLKLGDYPLFLEEPRRALISLEMMLQDNLFVPTQTGDPYFRKPPVFNWVVILFSKMFGGITEFGLRSISVLSHLTLGGLVYWFFKSRTKVEVAILTALSYVLSVDILYYFSTLGEIDLFYALLTSLSIMLVFHFGEREKYWSLFISVYVLTALCFLTKGFSALPYTAITLLVYFIAKRNFLKLLSPAHFVGIGLFFALIGAYFYAYSLTNNVTGWWTTLFSESANKASNGGLVKWFLHVVSFPLDTLKNIIPAALLLPALFAKGDKKRVARVWFWLILLNFAIYWFSTGGRSRYIYPLFPFMCYWVVEKVSDIDAAWFHKYLGILTKILLVILTLAIPVLPFVDELAFVDDRWTFVILIEVCLGFIWLSLYKYKIRSYLLILGVLVVAKLCFSYLISQSRLEKSNAAKDKALAYEISEVTGDAPIYRWGDIRFSLTTVFYLEQYKQQVLYQKDVIEEGAYYWVHEKDLETFPESMVINSMVYNSETFYLLKPH